MAEHRSVAPVVEGSIPFIHPNHAFQGSIDSSFYTGYIRERSHMSKKKLDQKTSALLALEAKMIEKDQEVYSLETYIPDLFSDIEEVIATENPERLLDEVELKTFQTLIHEHTGGERRENTDRRTKNDSFSENRRDLARRWMGKPRQISE